MSTYQFVGKKFLLSKAKAPCKYDFWFGEDLDFTANGTYSPVKNIDDIFSSMLFHVSNKFSFCSPTAPML